MVPVKVTFYPDENGSWIASCPELELMTQGNTYEEAEFNLKDALMLFFESCIRRGTLDQVLKEAGYQPDQQRQVQKYLDGYIPQLHAGVQECRA